MNPCQLIPSRDADWRRGAERTAFSDVRVTSGRVWAAGRNVLDDWTVRTLLEPKPQARRQSGNAGLLLLIVLPGDPVQIYQ